jgi:hypothetical protein
MPTKDEIQAAREWLQDKVKFYEQAPGRTWIESTRNAKIIDDALTEAVAALRDLNGFHDRVWAQLNARDVLAKYEREVNDDGR